MFGDPNILGNALSIIQIHPLGPTGTIFQYSIDKNGSLRMLDNVNGQWTNNVDSKIGNLFDFYNKAHTIRTTVRKGRVIRGKLLL